MTIRATGRAGQPLGGSTRSTDQQQQGQNRDCSQGCGSTSTVGR